MAQMMEKIKEILSNNDKTAGDIESESDTFVVYSAYGGTTANVPEAFYPGSMPVAPRETHYQRPYSGALRQQQEEYNIVTPVNATSGAVSSDTNTGVTPKNDGKGESVQPAEDNEEFADRSKTSERSIGDDVLKPSEEFADPSKSSELSIGDDIVKPSEEYADPSKASERSTGDDAKPSEEFANPSKASERSTGDDVAKPSDGPIDKSTTYPTGWDENPEPVEKSAVDLPNNEKIPISKDEEFNTASEDSLH